MNLLKRTLGLLWMVLAPTLIYFLVMGAVHNVDSAGTKDINKPIPWAIIITIFTPIAIGLFIFGYYSFKGEYDRLPQSSDDL